VSAGKNPVVRPLTEVKRGEVKLGRSLEARLQHAAKSFDIAAVIVRVRQKVVAVDAQC